MARESPRAKGRVEATELTGLTPQSKRASKGCVIIGGEEYEVGKTDAQEYIACKIEFYYRANEADKELVSIWGGKQERLTIAARDIDQSKQDESVIYYGEGKSARVADGAVILYNGRAAERTVKHLRPETGSMTLVDSQNSGVYDLVFIEEFQSFLVDGFSQRDEKIYLQDGSFLGEGYIDISHPGADGRIILPEAALAKNDAISVFASEDGKLLRITLQGNPARGEIASIQAGENIQVGDKTYSLAKQWQVKDDAALQPGDKVTLYFDHSGDVFYISPQKALSNYGFPMAVQMKDAVSGTLQFKILTKEGEIKVFDATEKIRVEQGDQNAVNLSGSELLQRLCPSGSLMKELLIYEVNGDGKINGVTLPFDASNIDGKPSKEGQYSSVFSKDWNMDGSTGYYYAYGRLEDIRICDDTYVFAPAMKEDGTYDEKLATVTNRGYFSSSNNAVNFKMAIYDIDKGGTANAILVMDTATKGFAQEEWDVVVVDKIIPAIDKEGNEVKQLQGKQNGSPLSWTIAEQVTNLNLEENGTDEDIYQLKRGDVLIFELNIKGEIGVYQILYRKGQQKDGWIYAFGAGYGSVKATSMQVFAGTVEYLDDKVLKVKGTDSLTVFDVEGDFLVYECKQERVVMSDMGSIQEGKTKLVAFGNRNSVTSVIIYQD